MTLAIFMFLIIFTFICLFCRAFLLNTVTYHNKKTKPPYAVLPVKNCEDNIEGLIRLTIWQIKNSGYAIPIDSLIVIDLGSNDETPVILEKLANEYPGLYYINKKQSDEIMGG